MAPPGHDQGARTSGRQQDISRRGYATWFDSALDQENAGDRARGAECHQRRGTICSAGSCRVRRDGTRRACPASAEQRFRPRPCCARCTSRTPSPRTGSRGEVCSKNRRMTARRVFPRSLYGAGSADLRLPGDGIGTARDQGGERPATRLTQGRPTFSQTPQMTRFNTLAAFTLAVVGIVWGRFLTSDLEPRVSAWQSIAGNRNAGTVEFRWSSHIAGDGSFHLRS